MRRRHSPPLVTKSLSEPPVPTGGGSCYSGPQSIRSADRLRYSAVDRGGDVGFRIARTLGP